MKRGIEITTNPKRNRRSKSIKERTTSMHKFKPSLPI
jgi:hypothetical protein